MIFLQLIWILISTLNYIKNVLLLSRVLVRELNRGIIWYNMWLDEIKKFRMF